MTDTRAWHLICDELAELLRQRATADGDTSYSARLLQGSEDTLLKKLAEEAGEAMLAAKAGKRDQLCEELADLWFHCLIVMTRYNIQLSDIAAVLARRRGTSGLAEKALRTTD